MKKTLMTLGGLVVLVAIVALAAWKLAPAPHAAAPAAVGGDFTLIDQDGRRVDQSLLKGRWSAVFFGYTYCPDVCPTTMAGLGTAQDLMGAKGRDLQVVFISVDPGRDTPEQLKTYLSTQGFPKNAVGLTGSPEQVAQAAKAYRVFYEKSGDGPNYLVNHSTAIYVMNPKGRFDRVLAYGLGPEEMARQITDAMRGA